MRRNVRAAGFRDAAFEETVGKDRYRWMRSLGNRRIVTRSGPRIQINDPAAAEELLGMALARVGKRQRLVIFCSCGLPGRPGAPDGCHRTTVASLLLKAAAKRKVSLTIVEWPGGQPRSATVRISDADANKVMGGARNANLGTRQPPDDLLRLPWGSVVRFKSPTWQCRAIADPPVFRGGKWLLPLPFGVLGEDFDGEAVKKQTLEERRLSGLDARNTVPPR
jgi:hypothetical protein